MTTAWKPKKKSNRSEKNVVNLQILRDYRNKLHDAAQQLSDEVDERIPMTHIIYCLIDEHLDDALKKLKKEY